MNATTGETAPVHRDDGELVVTVSYVDYGRPELFNSRRTLVDPAPDKMRRR